MKLLTSITAVLAALSLSAQDYNFNIVVARNQSVSTALQLGITHINFNTFGSHFTDGMDATQFVVDSSYIRPYTIDSAGNHLMTTDSRPHIQSTLEVPYGIWSNSTDEVYMQGSWADPNLSNLYDVVLIENSTGFTYNMYNENNFSLPADVAFNNQFTLVFTPKVHVLTFDESCYGQGNGSAYVQSPEPNWSVEVYRNSILLNTFAVAGRDTFLANLNSGNYTFIYSLNNNAIDTLNTVVAGPGQIVASYTMSNISPEANELITFTNNSTGAMEFEWDFGDGNTSDSVSPSHTYAAPGFYAVTLTAYNFEGCSVTSTTPVNVTPASASRISNRSESDPHHSQRETEITVVSQEGQANVTAANEIAIAQLTVYSVTGQLIYSGTGNNNTFSYETPGIYIAKVVYANGQEESKKVSLN